MQTKRVRTLFVLGFIATPSIFQLSGPFPTLILNLAADACAVHRTYNQRDFVGCERLGIEAITPGEFLRRIGVYR